MSKGEELYLPHKAEGWTDVLHPFEVKHLAAKIRTTRMPYSRAKFALPTLVLAILRDFVLFELGFALHVKLALDEGIGRVVFWAQPLCSEDLDA
jgi:hypothetical protein